MTERDIKTLNGLRMALANLGGRIKKKTEAIYLCIRQRRRQILFVLLLFPGVPLLLLYLAPAIQEATIRPERTGTDRLHTDSDPVLYADVVNLEKEVSKLKNRYASLTGSQPYLVINTRENSFRLFSKRTIIGEGVCSTGSYILLRNGDKQQWLFETPKGLFRIQSKTTNPVWKKPDWAFVEEGLPVPKEDDGSRFEYGVLGEYALGLGDGYLIHGTLYQRFLGMPVTHGCVRMNDADLEKVYNTLVLGSKVFIY